MMDAPIRVLFGLALLLYFVLRGVVRVVWGLCTFWRWLPRRPPEPGFRYPIRLPGAEPTSRPNAEGSAVRDASIALRTFAVS